MDELLIPDSKGYKTFNEFFYRYADAPIFTRSSPN